MGTDGGDCRNFLLIKGINQGMNRMANAFGRRSRFTTNHGGFRS